MQASNAPSKSAVPFAQSGTKNTIPVNSQIGVTPGAASFTDGFPPLTMTPLAAGGVPPYGADFNGILNFLSAATRWGQAGAGYSYDASFSAGAGGYPKGAVLLNAAQDGFWINLADNNTTNPDDGGANWTPAFNQGSVAIPALSNANVTLTPAQFAKPIVALSGTLTGNVQVIFPANRQRWLVVNNASGAFSVTCKTAAGSGVVVPNGNSALIFGDGTAILMVTGNQASETVQGTSKIATQAQTNAGTDDATVVTPKKLRFGVSMSLGVNGYLALPSWLGGVIFQWGRSTVVMNTTSGNYYTGGVTITLPIPFPNQIYGVFPSIQNTPNAMDSISVSGMVNGSISFVGCTSNESQQSPTCYYFAIGN
ncbi:hypothetical protein [Achromobacter sp.]|jgi:hypothetical protein|uniref:gp53-like domain-containing protein n=1 Tax=Achromobacter sp. TaxID=134375 RepID=UPI0028AEFBC2|nr:hypothetical protein [Achromobacter sp.]